MGKLENTCKQKECVSCSPTIFFCCLLNNIEAMIGSTCCSVICCSNASKPVSWWSLWCFPSIVPYSPYISSLEASDCLTLCTGMPPLLSRLWWGLGDQSAHMKALPGGCGQEKWLTGTARYHFLPIAASVNKMNWAGQALLRQLFTWSFQASLKCWEHSQSSHLIFLEAVCLWFSPALQMATHPGHDLGR